MKIKKTIVIMVLIMIPAVPLLWKLGVVGGVCRCPGGQWNVDLFPTSALYHCPTSSAISGLGDIATSQGIYREEHGSYATSVPELMKDGIIDEEIWTDSTRGDEYDFSVLCAGRTHYVALAEGKGWTKGYRLILDQSGWVLIINPKGRAFARLLRDAYWP